jgi:FkbM family methyltransferase
VSKWKSIVRNSLPRRVKAHRILGGPLRGRKLVTSWHDYPGALIGRTEAALLGWFGEHVRPGTCWLDVGAHYGYTALALAELTGAAGRVVAFEPMPATAGSLAETRRINGCWNMTLVPFGLAADGRLRFVEVPIERGMASPVTNRSEGTETIIVWSYDAIEASLGLSRVDGVKIDVQGMELEVLRGMRRMLERDQPQLVIEFHSGVDRREALDLLASVGYKADGAPIESSDIPPRYLDNVSYHFRPDSLS